MGSKPSLPPTSPTINPTFPLLYNITPTNSSATCRPIHHHHYYYPYITSLHYDIAILPHQPHHHYHIDIHNNSTTATSPIYCNPTNATITTTNPSLQPIITIT